MNELTHETRRNLIREFRDIGIDFFALYAEETQRIIANEQELVTFDEFYNALATLYLAESLNLTAEKRFQYEASDIYNLLITTRLTFEMEGKPHQIARGGGFSCTELPDVSWLTPTETTSSDS